MMSNEYTVQTADSEKNAFNVNGSSIISRLSFLTDYMAYDAIFTILIIIIKIAK